MASPTGPRPTEESLVIDTDRLSRLKQSTEGDLWTKHSIYKVPPYMFHPKKNAYEPHLVSIGPYHHGKPHLRSMEEHKHRALHHLLKRSNKHIDDYRKMLSDVLQDLMDSYEQLDDKWRDDRDKFLQLMILDGIFLLELLCSYSGIIKDYGINDPVFSFHGSVNILHYIVSDALMVENQLPLLVLERMVAVESGTMVEKDKNYKILNNLVVGFFIPSMKPVPEIGEGLHVLDLVRKGMILGPPANTSRHLPSDVIRSASDLHDAGVEFRRSKTESIRDITFSNGILSLPIFIVEGGTESFYLNVLAFERLHPSTGREVSSFIAFMYGLINSEKDARLLRSLGFIQSTLGSDESIADLTKELARDMYFDPYSPLCEVRDALNLFYKKSMKQWSKRIREWRSNLMQNYFKTPWTLISVVAAAFLLALTMTQTYYTALAYYNNNPAPNPPTTPPH
ncbi:UPF0481 protein At3g47200-like isoform X2 [Tasmannia lanceolata]|uniref:UPF0481 protein At3g47200-like isoform X2 n=1 Tax=Tasmannia lanceolata TaxID=3420 RepID=UPI00406450D9